MLFFQERSNIEKEYAKQLKQWSNKWESIIQKGDFSKHHPKGDFSSSKTASKKVGKHLSPLKRWKRGKHKLSEAFSFAKHCCLERRMHTYPSPQIHTSSGDNVWFWERPLNPCFVLVPGFTVVLVLSSEHTIRKNKTQNWEWKDLENENELFLRMLEWSHNGWGIVCRGSGDERWHRFHLWLVLINRENTKQSNAKFSELASCRIYL